MRDIQWRLNISPTTFQPVCILFVDDKEETNIHYTLEAVHDLRASYGEDFSHIFDVKGFLNDEMKAHTDLTDQERVFALGDGFKPTYTEEQKKWQTHAAGDLQILTKEGNSAKRCKFMEEWQPSLA